MGHAIDNLNMSKNRQDTEVVTGYKNRKPEFFFKEISEIEIKEIGIESYSFTF